MDNFNVIKFINDIAAFSPRQGKNEEKTAQFIIQSLGDLDQDYQEQKFTTEIPVTKKEVLIADGEEIKCKGCSFIGGKIDNKNNIVSSLISSQPLIDHSNINFNPACKGISLSNFYFAPSVAVNSSDLNKIINAKEVQGIVDVASYKHQSSNILVGNTKDPKNILFAHYDSIEKGVIDNASGVGALMYMIFKYRKVLENSLLVFSGNEELSYDHPIYWGHGFRVFEDKYKSLLNKSKKIFIVDCVGNTEAVINKDKELIDKGFPLKNLDKLKNKIFFAHGDIDNLMEVYHSDLDIIEGVSEKNIIDAVKLLVSNLEN